MSRRTHPTPIATEPTVVTPISSLGLFIPFVVVFIAVLFAGHTPAQIAGASLLLLVPAIILVVRRRALKAS